MASLCKPRRLVKRANRVQGHPHPPHSPPSTRRARPAKLPPKESALIKSVGFVHCHAHSAYSLREGALTIETLAESGVQSIIGAQLVVDFGDAPGGGVSRVADLRLQRVPRLLVKIIRLAPQTGVGEGQGADILAPDFRAARNSAVRGVSRDRKRE